MNFSSPYRPKSLRRSCTGACLILCGWFALFLPGAPLRGQEDPGALLRALALKANDGNEDAAKALSERLLSAMPARVDPAFVAEVDSAGAAEAAGIRALVGGPILEFPSNYAGGAEDYIAKGVAGRAAWQRPHLPTSLRWFAATRFFTPHDGQLRIMDSSDDNIPGIGAARGPSPAPGQIDARDPEPPKPLCVL
jgi:hypothetical protein